MDETYRMLGRERELDFGREAVSRRLAADAHGVGPELKKASRREERRAWQAPLRARIALFVLTQARRREARDAL